MVVCNANISSQVTSDLFAILSLVICENVTLVVQEFLIARMQLKINAAVEFASRVGSIHFFLIFKFKFKFIDFEKIKFKFKFIDCEKTKFKFKFKFIDFEKSKFKFKFKFIDFAKVEFKFKFKFINNS